MIKPSKNYLNKMRLNIQLAYFRWFFQHLIFILPIWYAFETQFANPATLGIIYAISHLITVALELPTGALADLMGRKKTIILGLFIVGSSWLYMSQAKTALWLWSGYLLQAVGAALISGADVALDFDSLKELGKEKTYAKFQSKVGLVIRLGIIIAIFIGGYIYTKNTRTPYILIGISTLVAALITFKNTEPIIDTEKFSFKSYIKQTKAGLRQLFKNDYIKDLSIYYIFIGGITWYFLYFLNMAYATEIGFNAIERSWLFSTIYILSAVINFIIVRSKHLTRERVYVMFPLIMILGFLPSYWAGRLVSVILIFLITFAAQSRFSILDQFANEEFESRYRATAISSLNMAVSILFSLISIIGGKLTESYGASFVMTTLGVLTIFTTTPTAKILLTKHNNKR